MLIDETLSHFTTELALLEKRKKELINALRTSIAHEATEAIKGVEEEEDRDDILEEITDEIYSSRIREYIGGELYLNHTKNKATVSFEQWETSHC